VEGVLKGVGKKRPRVDRRPDPIEELKLRNLARRDIEWHAADRELKTEEAKQKTAEIRDRRRKEAEGPGINLGIQDYEIIRMLDGIPQKTVSSASLTLFFMRNFGNLRGKELVNTAVVFHALFPGEKQPSGLTMRDIEEVLKIVKPNQPSSPPGLTMKDFGEIVKIVKSNRLSPPYHARGVIPKSMAQPPVPSPTVDGTESKPLSGTPSDFNMEAYSETVVKQGHDPLITFLLFDTPKNPHFHYGVPKGLPYLQEEERLSEEVMRIYLRLSIPETFPPGLYPVTIVVGGDEGNRTATHIITVMSEGQKQPDTKS
jgi:hypothetical protein